MVLKLISANTILGHLQWYASIFVSLSKPKMHWISIPHHGFFNSILLFYWHPKTPIIIKKQDSIFVLLELHSHHVFLFLLFYSHLKKDPNNK